MFEHYLPNKNERATVALKSKSTQLNKGFHRCCATPPPSRCSLLHAPSLPSAPSLALAATPLDPHLDQLPPSSHMTRVAPVFLHKTMGEFPTMIQNFL